MTGKEEEMVGRYGWIILVMFLIGMIKTPSAQAFVIERPVKGQTVVAGEPYDVWVRLVPGEVCDSVGPGLSFNAKTGRYEGTDKVDPGDLRGVSEEIPILVLGEGAFCRDAKVKITVILPPTTKITGIDARFSLNDKQLTTASIARRPNGELIALGGFSDREVSISATYSDGVKRKITDNPDFTYKSLNEKVAIVFPPGQGKSYGSIVDNFALVRATGPGQTDVIVQYGEFTDRVTLKVRECPYIEGKMEDGCPR